MKTNNAQKAVFLDRDGTLIEEVNFLSRVEDLRFFSFTDECVRRLKEAGYLVIVVTNQSGIGRGIFDEAAVHSIHDAITARLSAPVDAFYFCPHLPDAGCACRKPATGMIDTAGREHDIDLNGSWMIGDKRMDIETGFAAGISTALVRTGYGKASALLEGRPPDLVAKDLSEAVDIILAKAAAE